MIVGEARKAWKKHLEVCIDECSHLVTDSEEIHESGFVAGFVAAERKKAKVKK